MLPGVRTSASTRCDVQPSDEWDKGTQQGHSLVRLLVAHCMRWMYTFVEACGMGVGVVPAALHTCMLLALVLQRKRPGKQQGNVVEWQHDVAICDQLFLFSLVCLPLYSSGQLVRTHLLR